MASPDRTHPIKPGAKLDPKGTALVKKIQALSKQARADFGDHVSRIRIMPKNLPPSEHCSCSCGCS
ncbi:MAG TPA: hypothetical protein VKW08_25560 [Xanthobacteraceae bacterium]|jgi:hypothetical protein|nr:hypothetical protein [Xanthobacteraceae bacterium]